MEPVRKVLIDEGLLFGEAAAEEDTWNLLPGAAILLLRLQHSNLCVVAKFAPEFLISSNAEFEFFDIV